MKEHEHWFDSNYYGSKTCPVCGEKFDLPIVVKNKKDNKSS